MDVDEAYYHFKSIALEYSEIPELSEADTRCKIIDRIFKECLGWTENDIRREEHVHVGYIDYTLLTNSTPSILVEAKKTEVVFNIPKSVNKRNYKINGIIRTIDSLDSALRQVRDYCFDIGVRYAVVTNGTQFIIFSAYSPGQKWDETSCIVFNSLNDIETNFSLFWDLLNTSSINTGILQSALSKAVIAKRYKKILTEIYNPNQKWERNKIYTYLQPIVDFIFTEMLDAVKLEVLQKCYVFDRSNRNLSDEIDELFIDKMPFFADHYQIKDIYEREIKAGVFQKEFEKMLVDLRSLPLAVLLGGIGSGKSTFIHRFFKIVLADKETLQWYYIDFRQSSIYEDHIEEYIYEKIFEEYKNKYEKILSEILIKSGFNVSEDDKRVFIKKLFSFLLLIKIPTVLVIDNVDQHEYRFQEKLFKLANYICSELKVITILSLREETFMISTRTGVFDAYHIPKFHISSPNFLNLLKSRIEFTISFLQRTSILKSYRIDDDTGKQLIHFFEILLRSFAKDNEQSRQIVHFFDTISVGNMREALRMFNSFLTSGNTNIEEMFKREKSEKNTYQVSFHQLLKSIILGEHRFYSSERSHIANVFDFDTSLSDSHFNQLRILNYLIQKENSKSEIGRGFVDINDVMQKASDIIISKEVIIDSLKRLVQYNLIQFDNQSVKDLDCARYVTITPAGQFYFNDLIYQFGYLEPVSVDTPISDIEIHNNIYRLIGDTSLRARLIRASLFINYLIECEIVEKKRNHNLLSMNLVI